jgi:ABC-type sugar transport system permease subunit
MTTVAGSIGSVTGRVTRRLDRMSDGAFAGTMFIPGAILVFVLVIIPILLFLAMSLFRIELAKDENTLRLAWQLRQDRRRRRLPGGHPAHDRFGAGMTAIAVPLALATALLLNRPFRGAAILGVLVPLPWAIAPVVTGTFWGFIFNSHFGVATGRDAARADEQAHPVAHGFQPRHGGRGRGVGTGVSCRCSPCCYWPH